MQEIIRDTLAAVTRPFPRDTPCTVHWSPRSRGRGSPETIGRPHFGRHIQRPSAEIIFRADIGADHVMKHRNNV